jgi:prolyl 4-hydroxylase
MNLMPPHWIKWIDENIKLGNPPGAMIATLVQNKFEPNFCAATVMARMEKIQKEKVEEKAAAKPAITNILLKRDDGYLYEDIGVKLGNSVQLADRNVKVAINLQRPRITLFEEVLTRDECKQLIELSRPKLKRSMMVDMATGEPRPDPTRTSDGTYFKRNENAFITMLDKRIEELIQLPIQHSEELQILNYQVGGEYKPHYDFFPPNLSGSAAYIARGQRVATLILYLNDVEEGGETVFPEIGLKVIPKAGNALYFTYMNSTGQCDPLTLHAGCPVIKGEKWIATRWVRERGY